MHSDRYSFLMSLALALWVLVSSFTINTVLPVRAVHAQTMDYNLSQAIRAADSIGSSLQRLQPNDVNGATRLQQKLDKAASLLQTSESSAHPDYRPTVDKLAALQQQMDKLGGGQTGTATTAQQSTGNADTTQPQATMDYNLSKAIRDIESIASGLQRLRENDVHGFNRLSTKLNQAAELLQGSESKGHPQFQPAAQQWTILQQQMAKIAVQLQQAQAQQQQQLAEQQAQRAAAVEQQKKERALQQQAEAQERAKAIAEAEQKQQAKVAERNKAEQLAKQQEANKVTLLEPLKAKYNRQSLPALAEQPTPELAQEWATQIHALQTTTVQDDIARIDAWVASGDITEGAARNAKYWITDGAQIAVAERIRNARLQADGAIASMQYSAEMILAVESGDMNGAYRFAGADKYVNNQQRLDNAIRAGAVVDVYNRVFGNEMDNRAELVKLIVAARDKLDALKPMADEQAVVLANAEPATPPSNKEFLAPIAQEYWFEGSVLAESDKDGGIWMDGNQVGDITHNGEIWVGSNEMGSIEPNGEVWFDSDLVGSLEPNGEVWRGSNQVGLIEQNGTVWINGNPTGEIEPFQGEWKRAAIIYYFTDFFVSR
jgi:hypothetical protein